MKLAIMPKLTTNENGQGKDRMIGFELGFLWQVTTNERDVFNVASHFLNVHLLTNILTSKVIGGISVAHGNQVAMESTEAWIMRIYSSQKRRDPCFFHRFSRGPMFWFFQVDEPRKAHQVRNLSL